MVHGSPPGLAREEVEAFPGVLMHLNKRQAVGFDRTPQCHILHGYGCWRCAVSNDYEEAFNPPQ